MFLDPGWTMEVTINLLTLNDYASDIQPLLDVNADASILQDTPLNGPPLGGLPSMTHVKERALKTP